MISVGTILGILFAGLKYFMPSKVNVADISLPKSTFKRIYLLTYVLWILSGIALTALFYFLLQGIEQKTTHEYIFALYPDSTFWIGVSAIAGFSLGIVAMFALIKAILKEQSDEFWALYDDLYKFRATSLLQAMAVFLAAFAVIQIGLGKNVAFKIYPDRIRVSRLYEISSKVYSMDKINEINHRLTFIAPNGNRVDMPHFEIVFEDGYSWNTIMDMREPQEIDGEAFLEISNYSGKPINEIN